jgi:hypothetical protein
LLSQSQWPKRIVAFAYRKLKNSSTGQEFVTTLVSWGAVDQRGPSALYMASDSRITWGSERLRWDAGRKLFACRVCADIFGYVGEVIFPSLVLGQIIAAADDGLLFNPDDSAELRHAAIVQTVKTSFQSRHHAPDYDFAILHGAREAEGMTASFHLWLLSYFSATSAAPARWTDEEVSVGTHESSLIISLGSGGHVVEKQNDALKIDPQGRTSRAVFWAFCDALRSKADPLSGGAPQLVGLYRKGRPQSFGVSYNGHRYYQGLLVQDSMHFDGVEWRDEKFQRVDGATLEVLPGAQRHGRPEQK